MYLHQNVPAFYGDISDLASCLETFSLNDYVQNQSNYCYSIKSQADELKSLCAYSASLATTENNNHMRKPEKLQLEKSQIYDGAQQLRTTKLTLSDACKSGFSDEMLI